ncbi:CSLREA domain-containing protein [Salinisphaera sp. P385]|uniref:CSLREA domain-containing protein n=1 Tax=Spectribacter acetivorans TaxID=3075603 RepID=A0ABU3B8A9_9GAMM|nr:CSLREA domain-containing protein [Salinisphaera sp. P385]MDT0618715.1 CSLREA domain-containing protein [Salinisphaera sp. P385]
MFAATANAATFTVTTTADNEVDDGECTLREAVALANGIPGGEDACVTNGSMGDADGDIINFDDVDLAGEGQIVVLTEGSLRIEDDVTIDGFVEAPQSGGLLGALVDGLGSLLGLLGDSADDSIDENRMAISGGESARVFFVDTDTSAAGNSGSVTFQNLIVANGLAAAGDPQNGNGGGIHNTTGTGASSNSLTLINTLVAGNESTADAPGEGGGGIFNSGNLVLEDSNILGNSVTGLAGNGGGILNAGNLNVTDGNISGNTAFRAGGGVEQLDGSATFSGTAFAQNNAGGNAPNPGNGGAVHVTAGDTEFTNITATGNIAAREGGALWNNAGQTMTVTNGTYTNNIASGPAADDGGGALFNNGGVLNVDQADFSNNQADGESGSGGAIFNGRTETSAGQLTINGGNYNGNAAVRAGGGIEDASGNTENLRISGITADGNRTGTVGNTPANPGNGGFLHVSDSTGVTTIEVFGGTYRNNTAAREGGALWNGAGTMIVEDAVIQTNTASGDAADDGGGGIFNNGGTLTIRDNTTIDDNRADGDLGSGGGIFNAVDGTVDITSSSITGNRANRAGGGIEDASGVTANAVTLTDVTLSGNNGGDNPGNGGGLHVTGNGNIVVMNSTIRNNTAAEGGGLWNNAGEMSVTDSIIENNTANGDAADQGGGGVFNQAGTLIITSSALNGNDATGTSGSGGAAFNDGDADDGVTATLTIDRSSIFANTSQRAGGGIENNAGSVEITRTVIGGLDETRGNITGNTPGNGGALHTTGAGDVTVDDSAIVFNTASEGGGLWNSGAGTLTVANSTVSNNMATASSTIAGGLRGGGGVFNDGGTTTLINVTVTQNESVTNGGGIASVDGAFITANNTIIDNNRIDNAGTNDGPDAFGDVTADSSFIGNTSGANVTGDVLTGDAQLDELTVSGNTLIHVAPFGSPAVDAGNDTICDAAPIDNRDQRGVVRDFDGDGNGIEGCDIGAVEFTRNPVLTLTGNGPAEVPAISGDENVTALAFTLTNNTVESVDVDGFNGTVTGDVSTNIADAEVYLDNNGNGNLDAGEASAMPIGNVQINASGQFFVTLNPERTLMADGGDESYIIVIDIAADTSTAMTSSSSMLFAGGGLFLALASLGGLRRRIAWPLAALALAVGLSACGGSGGGGGGGGDDGGGMMPPTGNLQFTLMQVTATGQTGNAVADNLPLEGPAVTISSE